MTVLAAALRDGTAVMACDTRTNWGTMYTDGETKISRLGGALLGTAGMSEGYTWRESLTPLPEDATISEQRAWCVEVAASMRAWFGERGHGGKTQDAATVPLWVLVATRSALWNIDQDGSVNRIHGESFAEGSGAPIALGAMHALRDLEPVQRVRAAVEAAIAYDMTCGGRIDTLHLPAPSAAAPSPR